MNTKTCNCCKVEKTTDNFHKNKNYKDGLNYYCKPCMKEKRQASMDKKPEKYKDYMKTYYQNNKKAFAQYKLAKNPYVYRIRHKTTGEYYIGNTSQVLNFRVLKHFAPDYNTSSPFTGKNKNNYDIDILCFCSNKTQARRIEKDLLAARVGSDPLILNKLVGGC